VPKNLNGQLPLTDHGFRSAALSRVLSFPFIHAGFPPGYHICKILNKFELDLSSIAIYGNFGN
jgi:hypothetical protein